MIDNQIIDVEFSPVSRSEDIRAFYARRAAQEMEAAKASHVRWKKRFWRAVFDFAVETFWVYAVAALAVVVLNAVWPLIAK